MFEAESNKTFLACCVGSSSGRREGTPEVAVYSGG